MSDVVRGDDRRVLHLHGHWEEPESVVLGIRSYETVKNSEHTRAVLRAFAMTKSFLFDVFILKKGDIREVRDRLAGRFTRGKNGPDGEGEE